MPTQITEIAAGNTERLTLTRLCQSVLVSLTRADQRRWGEAYVRGLVNVPGRKSIRRISDLVVGRHADQCLQQFVNQSPWRWSPVRQRLAEELVQELPIHAWVLDTVVFPKNGNSSVGVSRQFVPSFGRTVNCQLALALCLANDEDSYPVNWRLMLPPSWDSDAAQTRRRQAHVPDGEHHKSTRRHIFDLLDETAVGWDLMPGPILIDARHETDIEPLLAGLDERGLRYAVRVRESAQVAPARSRGLRPLQVGELSRVASRTRMTLALPSETGGKLARSQFVVVPVPSAGGPALGAGGQWRRTRRLTVQWPLGGARPTGFWLTNLNTNRLAELARLLQLQTGTRRHLARLNEESGLQHFEGRSFRGWHHHVTLTSVAHAFRGMCRNRAHSVVAQYRAG